MTGETPTPDAPIAPSSSRRERFQERGLNFNTALLLVGILGGIFSAIKLGGPILNMPERSEKIEQRIDRVSAQVSTIETTQTFQAETLRRLTDLAAAGNNTSREVDRHTLEIAEIRRRLEKVEVK